MRAVIETALSKCPSSYMCDWAVRTDRAGRQQWESNYQHYSDKDPIYFFFFFFFYKIWYLAGNEREKIAFPIHPFFEGNVKHPIFTVWRLFTSDSDVKSRQTKKERNAKTVAMATNLLYIMRFHRSLCIFIIIFTRFSQISQPILNRFSRNFADTICNYYGDWPEKLVEFEPVLQKLLMRLFLNSIGYDKIY